MGPGKDRLTRLNEYPERPGRCVVYWAQSSVRAQDNPALAYAAERANALGLPLLVFYGIDRSIPMANERNFTFMLEGLDDLLKNIKAPGMSACVKIGNAAVNVVELCREAEAALLVTDESHLREGKRRREAVARKITVAMCQADANVVVPVRMIPGEQYAAYAIRPKLMKLLDAFLAPQKTPRVTNGHAPDVWSDVERVDIKGIIKKLRLPQVPASPIHGGEREALGTLRAFIDKKLDGYAENRNRPDMDGTSGLSPYLRFGHLSPVLMLREVVDSGRRPEDIAAFVEEAFVRRELAENLSFYDPGYRSLDSLPAWARNTLEKHKKDKRSRIFTLDELEQGETGDDLWDASQHEMARFGRMAGYMRMYWGKRVLEWTRSPGDALRNLLYLNDKYELDGRSPNGYAGVLWCFGKHDRAFGERPIYGKVRYMSPTATGKKLDVRAYFKKAGYARPGLVDAYA